MGRVKYSQFVDQIDVEEVMSAIGFTPEYEDNRGNYVGYCVWPERHSNGDTTGKFAIHPEKRVYNCYVCGGGSLLSLVMEFYDWDSETAENWLRQYAGDVRNDADFVEDFLLAFANDTEKRAETLPYFNPRVLEKWEPAYEYGASIGLNEWVIDKYNVLYAEAAVKRSPGRGKFEGVEDHVGPAIIWPHYWNDRLVGWQSRWLVCTRCWHDHPDGGQCDKCLCARPEITRPEFVKKWTNTVDFPKDSTLYGWHLVEPGSGRKLYVAESAKTVLKIHQLGRMGTGTFGSQANDAQLRLLRRFRSGIVLCPDNDKAGNEWFVHLYDYLIRYVPLEAVAPVPGAKGDLADLDDDDAEAWIEENTMDVATPHI
jgi:hypothetical protein